MTPLPRTDAPPQPQCFRSFEFPLCYYYTLIIISTIVLGLFVAVDLIVKIKHRRKFNKKAMIIGLLLLQCFLILNSDRSLIFFYFVCFYLQDLALCLILYYYSKKALKLAEYSRFVKWVKIPPITMGLIVTGFFIYDFVDYMKTTRTFQCQGNCLSIVEVRYVSLGIITLILSFLLFVVGVCLTVLIKTKLKDNKFSELKKEKNKMLVRFWIFLGILIVSHVVSVIQNHIIGDDHTCLFFPDNLVGDTVLKLCCNIVSFYLPIIIILLNFKTVIKPQKTQSRHVSQDIKYRGLLYYSHEDQPQKNQSFK